MDKPGKTNSRIAQNLSIFIKEKPILFKDHQKNMKGKIRG